MTVGGVRPTGAAHPPGYPHRVSRNAAPSGGSTEPSFDAVVKEDLRRVAQLSLQNITAEKAEQANIRDLATVIDKSLGRLEAIEGRAGNHVWYQIAAEYGIQPSHSASR